MKRELLRRRVRGIEELKTRDPKEFWKRLKGLNHPTPARGSVKEIKGRDGCVVRGEGMVKVWEEWFRTIENLQWK